jgi:hypothetical protein
MKSVNKEKKGGERNYPRGATKEFYFYTLVHIYKDNFCILLTLSENLYFVGAINEMHISLSKYVSGIFAHFWE